MRQRGTERGFGALELGIVLGLTGLFVLAFGDLFASTEDLAQRSRVHERAQSELRRNLDGVLAVLRGAREETLEGFGPDGRATRPSFGRSGSPDPLAGPEARREELLWEPEGPSLDGVGRVGDVVHRRGSERWVVARSVPEDGFAVMREAGALRVSLRTCWASDGIVAVVSGEETIALRD
jgi:hypothetical protein